MDDGIFKIVFCCRANVCRSPAAVTLFRAALPEQLADTVVLDDAGVQPSHVTMMCHEALAWITREGPSGILLESHVSSEVTVGTVANADLVVAMDSDVRAAVLRIALGHQRGLRERLFTMVEAAQLADAVRASLPGSGTASAPLRIEPMPDGAVARLGWMVAEMDAARGLVSAPRRSRWRSAPSEEIADAHDRSTRVRHKTMLPQLSRSVDSLVAAMRAIVEHPGMPEAGRSGQQTRDPGDDTDRQVITGLKR